MPALYRFLDTKGDGTGDMSAVGDYSSGQYLAIQPPKYEEYRLERLLVQIVDATVNRSDRYGGLAGALTNGIAIRTRTQAGDTVSLTNGVNIKSNGDWARYCYDVSFSEFASGENFVDVRWTFAKAGQPIILNGLASERLEVVLQDDLTGLVSHTFMVQGSSRSLGDSSLLGSQIRADNVYNDWSTDGPTPPVT